MAWNRPCDLTPIAHFSKHDTRNLNAARARLAEIRRKERDELVTPPEKLPSWKYWDPKRLPVRSVTAEVLGDPAPERSALGGWKQLGDVYVRLDTREHRRNRQREKKSDRY